MARLRYNGLTATLGADLLTADTTITFSAALESAAGAVPTITGTDYIPFAVLDADGAVLEIIHLTAYTSGATTGTVTRAQESTTAADHATGLTVVNGLTVADTTEFASAGASIATEYLHLRRTGGSQTATAGTWVDVTWGLEKNDSWGGYGGTGANWTVNESGLYAVHFKPAVGSTSVCYLGIFNGTDYVLHGSAGGSSGDTSPFLAGVAYLDSAATYTARIQSVAANTVLDGDFGYRTNLIVSKIK